MTVSKDTTPNADHIVPFAHGGLTTWENLQLLCPRCNLSKGDKL
ncbi:MAG: HNH endonuclease [Symploca sp. SIO1B1]|nr:HNH endonuclease [Symploca sp. SIO1B1]